MKNAMDIIRKKLESDPNLMKAYIKEKIRYQKMKKIGIYSQKEQKFVKFSDEYKDFTECK